ncbi:MAG TPA: molybdopterin biosynthesis protein [Pirellulaceae bacterium]|nr:molybdopterin biosynthesis protein [Pirellulaceae bacterium]
MTRQEQFLDVIDRDEAERRFHSALQLAPIGIETVSLECGLGRVMARDVLAKIDVPSFDRSNFDGFAVRASDTQGANEESPCHLRLLEEVIATTVVPESVVQSGTAVAIATGGMLPRGADAIVMVEHTDTEQDDIQVRRAAHAGFGVAFAGTDISAGETVLRRGTLLTSRETGVLAALGITEVDVSRRPRVGVVSTGDEIIAPGRPMEPGLIYDSNARIVADAVCEAGGEPMELGIVRDDLEQLRAIVDRALAECDIVLLSGGTSKGAGDLSYKVVREFGDPGIVAHGVALKPGKPICLAVTQGKPVVILPGFPTSAIFTFHEFVAPVIRRLAGLPSERRDTKPARLAVKVNSEIGRTEYLLVGLVEIDQDNLAAYPMGKGSGSVTTFSRADGFVTIDRHDEIVEAGTVVDVTLLGRDVRVADLVVIGSHCVGLDFLLGELQDAGFQTKFLAVGSTAGLEASRRGECDLAGVHLLDPKTQTYNRPFIDGSLELIAGYGRMQGVVFRSGDARFADRSAAEAIRQVSVDTDCLMINRNQGSGTRILIDQLLDGAQPSGYAVQSRNHNAVAAAILQKRADWGVTIETVAKQAGLGFLPLRDEQYDFVVPRSRLDRPAVKAFAALLARADVRRELARLGFVYKPVQ